MDDYLARLAPPAEPDEQVLALPPRLAYAVARFAIRFHGLSEEGGIDWPHLARWGWATPDAEAQDRAQAAVGSEVQHLDEILEAHAVPWSWPPGGPVLLPGPASLRLSHE